MNFIMNAFYRHRWYLLLIAIFTVYFTKEVSTESYIMTYTKSYFASCLIYFCTYGMLSICTSKEEDNEEQ